MNLNAAIRSRRTVRSYKDKDIPKNIARKIIGAGCRAPSVHNLQPWYFFVLSKKSKKGIADIMRRRSEGEFVFINTILKENAGIIEKAPLAMVVCSTMPLSKRLKRLGGFYHERSIIWEVQSVACCIENMMLISESMGIGCAFIGCVLLCDKEIKGLLNTGHELMGVLTFGYPKDKQRRLKKMKPERMIEYI
jgi:nitroreductase